MTILILAQSERKVSSVIRTQFSMKSISELVFKRYLDVEDWFHDKLAVQYRIPFQRDFLQKVNLC